MTVTKALLQTALSEKYTARDEYKLGIFRDAARFTERLLPGRCERHLGRVSLTGPGLSGDFSNCPNCHGTGQLWDEGLVEVVARAIVGEVNRYLREGVKGPIAQDYLVARAVLSALAGEVER